ncbi:MAG: PD40 domain-containing protein [Planctomycetes bacterium]|nr:PD40 domain-containing protein [Planctomycetota bacterium]
MMRSLLGLAVVWLSTVLGAAEVVPTDALGDPLPADAAVRLGSLRFHHGGRASAIAFSPRGDWLASGGWDHSLRRWEVPSGRLLARIDGGQLDVQSVLVAADGSIVTGNQDNTARRWDSATGVELQRYVGHNLGAIGLGIIDEGRTLVTSGGDATVRSWDFTSGAPRGALAIEHLRLAAISPDGSTLAWCSDVSEDHDVHLVAFPAGTNIRRIPAVQAGAYASALAFSHDGRALALGCGDLWDRFPSLILIDVASGGRRAAINHQLSVLSLAFSPDDAVVAIGGYATLAWHRVGDGQLVHTVSGIGHVAGISFAPDGARIAAAIEDGTVGLWDAASGNDLRPEAARATAIGPIAWSADGARIATTAVDGGLRIWIAGTGALELGLGAKDPIQALAYAPDGAVITGDSTGAITRWDIVAKKPTAQVRFQAHQSMICALALSHDGAHIYSSAYDGTLRRCEASSLKPLAPLASVDLAAHGIAVSPDDRRIAVACYQEREGHGETESWLGVCDVLTDRLLWKEAPAAEIPWTRVAFSPDGALIAAISDRIVIKAAATGATVRTIAAHANTITGIAFSPDGALVATSSSDGTVAVWEVATGAERQRLTGHTGLVTDLAFAPDGQRLASISTDLTALLWRVRR